MALLLDFIAIIFIVIIAFLFCNSNYNIKNSVNNSACLLSHIIVGFSVIIFYKLASRFKLNDILNSKFKNNNEYFYGDVNDFINGNSTELINPVQAAGLKPLELTTYISKLDTIINNLNALQQTQKAKDPLANTNPANLNSLDLSAQQQYQMFQIDYLNKQIQNVQDVLSTQNASDNAINYKPIKVFSSCVVANANGTTTTDVPVSSSFQNTGSSNSIDTDAILSAISQSNGQANKQANMSQLSESTGLFNRFLSNIQTSGNGNITIDALN
jgi:hypothetical protein